MPATERPDKGESPEPKNPDNDDVLVESSLKEGPEKQEVGRFRSMP